MRPGPRTLAALALAVTAGGCAGYSSSTRAARTALDAGAPKQALAEYNDLLDVDSARDPVADLSGDKTLYLLERATVLQQLGEHALASRDLGAADKRIEVLDFERGTVDDLGKYLYSDDSGPYKAPAYEKVMINTLNMVSYLERGDLSGARVEARRLAVMQKYLSESEADRGAFAGPGSYLAGFVFEKSGSLDEAANFYAEALAHGLPPDLGASVSRVAERAGRSSPALTELAKSVDAAGVSRAPLAADEGEVLVVVSYGRVPAKIARRIPIGLALTFAAGHISPTNAARANELAAQGLVTWVNYPELPRPKGIYETPTVTVDGEPKVVASVYDLDAASVAAWQKAKGAMIASAITRMLTRVVAGVAARQAARNSIIGVLLSLGTQATLTALDTPDTRGWTTLPSRVAILRLRLPAGKHTVRVGVRGAERTAEVTVAPGGWKVLSHTVLR